MPAQPDDGLIGPLIRSHYRQAGVIPGWTDKQLIALAALSNRTVEEIGAMAGLSPAQTREQMKRGRFSTPVSIHFLVIDKVLKQVRFGEPWMPVVPIELLARK